MMPSKQREAEERKAVRQQRSIAAEQRRLRALAIHRDNPDMSGSEIAARIGLEPSTVNKWIRESRRA
jgi:DNA-binding MarR family transcriptional regulator